MNKNKRFATFKKHYATFRVNQKTYYDNVKENFITQVNFVLWLWGVTQGRFLFFLTVKWFTIKKFARCNVRTQVRLSDSKKFWLADVPWLTVICSLAVASLIIFNLLTSSIMQFLRPFCFHTFLIGIVGRICKMSFSILSDPPYFSWPARLLD